MIAKRFPRRAVLSGRTAFTVVELLVVMGALVILAAVTLPSLKNLLDDQKVTAAVRQVTTHIDSVRARAIATGRPMAVILKRNTLDSETPNTVNRLEVGQVFPPYEGDVVGATGTLAAASGTSFYNLLDVAIPTASLLHPDANLFAQGDYIQLGDRQATFIISGVGYSALGSEPALAANHARIRFYNPPVAFIPAGDPTGTAYATREALMPVDPAGTRSTRYRIFRKPTKSYVGATSLPKGICVDLSVSGFGLDGIEFGVNGAAASSFSSPLIVFNERGNVAYVSGGGVSDLPVDPGASIHLMVGRTEQVNPAMVGQDVATNLAGASMLVRDPEDPTTIDENLNDEGNRWVTINPNTGAVYVSSIPSGSEAGTRADRLLVARGNATRVIEVTEEN